MVRQCDTRALLFVYTDWTTARDALGQIKEAVHECVAKKRPMRDNAKRLTSTYSVLNTLYLSAIRQGLSQGPGTMFTYLHYLREREEEKEEEEKEEEKEEGKEEEKEKE